MRKKQKVILLVVLSIIALAVILSKTIFLPFRNTETLMNKIGSQIFEFNHINVQVAENIDVNDFMIRHNSTVIFENGCQRNKMASEYGNCVLKLFYEDSLVMELGHYKTNNWYVYDYFFKINKKTEGFKIDCEIEGPENNFNTYKKMYVRDKGNKLVKIEYVDLKDRMALD